jgi:hypothetical protein
MNASKIAISVIILGLIGVCSFFAFSNFLVQHLNIELFKLSFQFLLIVVLGGAVTLAFTNFTKEKEYRIKTKEKSETRIGEIKNALHKFHNEFVQSYNSVKYIRRMFRARARIFSTETLIDVKSYDLLMQELTKNQLQFEFYIDEAESNPKLFEDKKVNAQLQDKVKLMRNYLNKIVTEYENCYKFFPEHNFVSQVQALPLKKLPVLADFIVKYSEAEDFKTNFRKPANDVQKALLSLLNTT